ncbi:MAG: YceI family protein [Planctomycetota bacterium]
MNLTTLLATAGVVTLGGALLSTVGLADPTPTAAATADGETYQIDSGHSGVVFKVGYMGVSTFYGRFNNVSGSYQLDYDNPSQSSIDIRIDAASVDTANAGRDEHLRGADFFSAKEFPEISFVGEQFESVDADTLRVTGDLTMRGVTESITVEIDWMGDREDPRGGYRSGIDSSMTINRSDFGVNYGVATGALGDETTIMIGLTGTRR